MIVGKYKISQGIKGGFFAEYKGKKISFDFESLLDIILEDDSSDLSMALELFRMLMIDLEDFLDDSRGFKIQEHFPRDSRRFSNESTKELFDWHTETFLNIFNKVFDKDVKLADFKSYLNEFIDKQYIHHHTLQVVLAEID